MPAIKKILFPIDFSDSSLATARHVQALAGHFEAEITLLHVVGMGELTLAEELLPRRKAQLDAYLTNEFKYFTTHRVCETGDDAAMVIEDAARQWHPDLIMMPTHGLGAFRRFLLGSVTAKVLHDLGCPVWTSAHLETAPPLEEIHCRKVLCSLDLGERSEQILAWAAWFTREFDACLGIVHAAADLPVAHYGWAREGEYAQRVSETLAQRVAQLQRETDTSAQVFVDGGDPAVVATAAARNFGADLMVIGRHGGPGEYLRQHAYAILRDSPCPVISI